MTDAHGSEPGRLNLRAATRLWPLHRRADHPASRHAPGEPGRLQVIYGEGRSIAIDAVRRAPFASMTADASPATSPCSPPVMTRRRAAVQACYVNPWESPAASGIDPRCRRADPRHRTDHGRFCRVAQGSGHRGPIYAMSRRGLLPQAHRPVTALDAQPAPTFASAQASSRCGASSGDSPRRRWRRWRLAERGRRHPTLYLGDLATASLRLEAALPAPRARLLGGASPPHGA